MCVWFPSWNWFFRDDVNVDYVAKYINHALENIFFLDILVFKSLEKLFQQTCSAYFFHLIKKYWWKNIDSAFLQNTREDVIMKWNNKL